MILLRHLSTLLSLLIYTSHFSATALAQSGSPEPLTLGYQGYITSLDRALVNGERDVTFRMYDALIGGTMIWEESLSAVPVSEGHFQVSLGLDTPLPLTTSPDTPLFLSVESKATLSFPST